MKKWSALAILTVLLIGCSKELNNPVSSYQSSTGTNTSFAEVLYSETSMYEAVLISPLCIENVTGKGVCFDSLRNARMLDSLKAYLSLTDDQFASVSAFSTVMMNTLSEIRVAVDSGLVTKDSARTLVQAARDQFIASVTAILTADQQTLFQTWITLYWDRKHGMGGHRGGGRSPADTSKVSRPCPPDSGKGNGSCPPDSGKGNGRGGPMGSGGHRH